MLPSKKVIELHFLQRERERREEEGDREKRRTTERERERSVARERLAKGKRGRGEEPQRCRSNGREGDFNSRTRGRPGPVFVTNASPFQQKCVSV